MEKGTINIQTENIFPIIKKFLYSDTEIFVRELVSNAVDACQKLKTMSAAGEVKGDIGELKVEVILDSKAKTITIKDNGIGMSLEQQEKLFTKFYQVDTSATREHGGTGLGLSICKGFVESMGGKIWVKSEPSHGSVFYFTIPLKDLKK